MLYAGIFEHTSSTVSSYSVATVSAFLLVKLMDEGCLHHLGLL